MNKIKSPPSTDQKKSAFLSSSLGERGQAMVETAFVMIILLLLLSVIIDLGRAFFTYLALQNAAAEGAYYATKKSESVDNSDNPDPDNITFRVKHESPDSALLDWNSDDVTVTVYFWCPPIPVDLENPTPEELERQRNRITAPPSSFVIVDVEYNFKTIGPVAGMLALVLPDAVSDWDGSFVLRAQTKQLILEKESATSVSCN